MLPDLPSRTRHELRQNQLEEAAAAAAEEEEGEEDEEEDEEDEGRNSVAPLANLDFLFRHALRQNGCTPRHNGYTNKHCIWKHLTRRAHDRAAAGRYQAALPTHHTLSKVSTGQCGVGFEGKAPL